MANTPTTPATGGTYTNVQLVSGAGTVLDEFPLIQASGGKYERNRRGFQALNNDTQAASGDGRRIVGERTMDLLIEAGEGTVAGRLYDLDQALEDTSVLRYEGVDFAVAGSRGITATQRIGLDAIRATVTYIPSEATGSIGGALVLGPL